MTSIEWTEATWNPIAGCTVHSPGCTNCYAMRTAARLATIPATAPVYAGLTQPSKAGPVWTGKIAVNESTMLAPLRRRKPTMYFVNSMSDLFHESVPDEVIDRVFAVMALCPRHTFQVLTKRSERMRWYLSADRPTFVWRATRDLGLTEIQRRNRMESHIRRGVFLPLPNVWLGVSVEDQKRADERIPDLLATPAAVRFLSCEPLLGPVDLTHIEIPMGCRVDVFDALAYDGEQGEADTAQGTATLDWVIVGGESGPGARPMHPDWARSLRDQCAAADVPFFFKQWGTWAPVCEMTEEQIDACHYPPPVRDPEASRRRRCDQCVLHIDGQRFDGEAMYRRPAFDQGSRAMTMMAIGKKAAGRTLDGLTHDAMPQVQARA